MILDRYEVLGAGPAGGSSARLAAFLDRWRARARAGDVVFVVDAPAYTHVLVLPAGEWGKATA